MLTLFDQELKNNSETVQSMIEEQAQKCYYLRLKEDNGKSVATLVIKQREKDDQIEQQAKNIVKNLAEFKLQ